MEWKLVFMQQLLEIPVVLSAQLAFLPWIGSRVACIQDGPFHHWMAGCHYLLNPAGKEGVNNGTR